MSNEFMGHDSISPGADARQNANKPADMTAQVDTEVAGIEADGMKDGLPVFNVDQDEFYQNMQYGRKRLRFKTEKLAGYIKGANSNRPFFIKYGDYMRKIK